MRVVLHPDNAAVADGHHRVVALDAELPSRLEGPGIVGVAALLRRAEPDDDLVADPDATLELDAVLLPVALGDDREGVLVVDEGKRPGV